MKKRTTSLLLSGCLALIGLILPGQALPERGALSGRYAGPVGRAAPVIQGIDPKSYSYEIPHAASGSYPQTVHLVITGKNFRPGAIVKFGKTSAKTEYKSATRLEADVPFQAIQNVELHGAQTRQGTAWITVVNVTPKRTTSARKKFPIEATAID